MRIYGHHLETEVEPFRDYLRAVRPKDTDELDIPEESEIEFNYGPKTQWTKEEYLRLHFKLRRHWYASKTWDDLFHFVVHCLPRMMESHHQSMSRLIAKWHYQQEKGLTWKEWAKGILDGQPIEGAPLEGTDLSRRESRCPEPTVPGWHPPMLEDVLTPPVVSASSESLEEEPQRIPNYSSTQGNQHLLSAQPSAPVSRTPSPEDWQAEERRRTMQAVKDITTGQPTPTLEENQMYDWDGQFDDTLGLPIQLRNRVSDPGSPPVRASQRAPGYGGGAGGATVNIGSGPGPYTVTKDTKGNSTGEAEELPSQQREDRTVHPPPQPQSWKTQTTKTMVGWTSPQEIHRQADFVPSGEGPGIVASADPRDVGTQREPLEPTPYGPPRTEEVRCQCLDFSMNTPIYPAPCQICGVQTIRLTTVREASEENRKIQAHLPQERRKLQGGGVQTVRMNIRESVHADGVTNLDTFHPNVLPGTTAMS